MAALSPASKIIARRLLAWDRARVASIERRKKLDVSEYRRQRIDLAEVCIDADIHAWPQEIRDQFRRLLEVTRLPSAPALQLGVGRLRAYRPALNGQDRVAYREMAREIGVLERLREVAPRQWADDAGEGD